jgi:hypothetical protein
MEAASTSETSVNFYQTTRHNNPDDRHLHTRRRKNLKSHLVNLCGEVILGSVRRFEALRILLIALMETASTSETSVNYQTTRRNIPEVIFIDSACLRTGYEGRKDGRLEKIAQQGPS